MEESCILDLEAFDFLYAVYQAPYPLNVIITPQTVEKYNRLFSFLLRVLRLNAATKRIYRLWLSDGSSPALHKVRFQIDQFVTHFISYVFHTAVGATWKGFMDRLERMRTGRGYDDDLFKTMDPVMLGRYHEHVLDRMLFQCFLKRSQRPVRGVLNRVLQDILDMAVTLEQQPPDKQLSDLHQRFIRHAQQFTEVLLKLHERGVGRLGNMMNSLHDAGDYGLFGDFYDRLEAKSGQGAFAQDLWLRLNMNGFYDESPSEQ